MILKAFIKSLPKNGDNIFVVRIPFMEDNTNNEMLFEALLCTTPGMYEGYRVGDCVFVAFENNKMNTPIILGKLYVSNDEDVSNFAVINNLKVTGSANLPSNSSIGKYTEKDIDELESAVNYILTEGTGLGYTLDEGLLTIL